MALEAEVGALADRAEIENVLRTMVRSMDEGDIETWLSIFGDDVEYSIYNYGNETPLFGNHELR